MRLAEHDGDLLHWFYDEGFVPGTKVECARHSPPRVSSRSSVDGDERAIAEKAAQGLYVRLAA